MILDLPLLSLSPCYPSSARANDSNTGPTSALANLAARLLAAKEGGMVPPMEERPDGHPVDVSIILNSYSVPAKIQTRQIF